MTPVPQVSPEPLLQFPREQVQVRGGRAGGRPGSGFRKSADIPSGLKRES